jgi:5-methylcytosine-specific restriction enzyme A
MTDPESKPARQILILLIGVFFFFLISFWFSVAIKFGVIPAIIIGVIFGILIWKIISFMNQDKVIIKIGNYEFDVSPLPNQPTARPSTYTQKYYPRSRHIPNEVRLQVKIKYHYRCAQCHRTEKEAGTLHHIDHIIPFSKGGTNSINNLQLLCEKCNLEKRDRW